MPRMSFTFTIMLAWMWGARGREARAFLRCQYAEWENNSGKTIGSAFQTDSVLVVHPVEGRTRGRCPTPRRRRGWKVCFPRSSILPSTSPLLSSPLLASVFLRIFVLGNDTISMQMMNGRTDAHGRTDGAAPAAPSFPLLSRPTRGMDKRGVHAGLCVLCDEDRLTETE